MFKKSVNLKCNFNKNIIDKLMIKNEHFIINTCCFNN